MKVLRILSIACVVSATVVYAQDTPDLPDLPETQTTPSLPDIVVPESTLPSVTPDSPQINSRLPRKTQEQIDQANKKKNWLTEGLKEKEMQAEALREEEARTQKSIIDEILERNQQQVSARNLQQAGQLNNQNNPQANSMKAALSTTAWEPLQPIHQSSLDTATANVENFSKPSEDYKKFDEKTGIANVFFNPATGGFESQPVDLNSSRAMYRPEIEQPWMSQNNQQQDSIEKRQVESFEAQMIQQARDENKLPVDYSALSASPSDSPSSLLAANTTAPNPNATNSNLAATPFSPQGQNQSSNAYTASAAKLRMMEEERQRKLKNDSRPKPVDLHSPNLGRKFEINPRF